MADYSHWRALCSQNKYWRSKTTKVGPNAKGNTTSVLSHSSYEGGTLCVPDDQLDGFYEAIGKDLQSGSARYYLVEFHTAVFPMYFDIDLKALTPELRQQIHDGLRCSLVEDVSKFYKGAPLHLFDSIWCVAEAPEPLTGLHIYMWKLFVTAKQAATIRLSLVTHLRSKFPLLLGKDDAKWEDIIDGVVYNNGLRMPGATLLKDCSHCKVVVGDKADPHCPYNCKSNRGKMCVGRRYVFLDLLASQETEHTTRLKRQLKGNWTALLKYTSLRKPGESVTQGYDPYPGCPIEENFGDRKTKANCLPEDDALIPDILHIIRGVKTCYKYVTIDKVVKLEKGALYRVFTQKGGNSTWCENKAGYHNSSRVYFEIRVSGVRIRCGCKKADLTGRQSGPCPGYSTQWVEIPPDVKVKLFPNKGHAVNLRQALRTLKKRKASEPTGRRYLAQSADLSFGPFLNLSREPSTSNSTNTSKTPSTDSSRSVSRRQSRASSMASPRTPRQ